MLSYKKDKSERKMVGAYLPRQFHVYLTLYGLAHNLSKSEVMEKIIKRWINYQCRYGKPEKQTEKHLTNSITKSLQQRWSIERTNRTKFSVFVVDCAVFLRSKQVPPATIETIINNLKE